MAKGKPEGFRIIGKVVAKTTGKGIADLIVEALDKDLFLDDRLGSAVTDKNGQFEIRYSGKDFQDIFFDVKPDIYLRVKNKTGNVIHTTRDKVRYHAGRTEEFIIVLEQGGNGGTIRKKVFKVALIDPQRNIIAGEGKVTLKTHGKEKPVIILKYNKLSRRYVTEDFEPGTYDLTASAPDGLGTEERIDIGPAGGRVTVMVAGKGMPFYYQNRKRVYYEIPPKLIAIRFQRGQAQAATKSLESLPVFKELGAVPEKELPFKADLTEIAVYAIKKALSDDALLKLRQNVLTVQGVKDVMVPEFIDKKGLVFFTSEIIVKFKPMVSRQQALEIFRKHDLEIMREFSYSPGAYLVHSSSLAGNSLLRLANELAESDLTVYAEPNLYYTMEDDLVPTDYLYSTDQWHLPLINAEAAWDITTGDHNITICVHDQGLWIDGSGNVHPDFDSTGLGWDKIHSLWNFQAMNNTTPPTSEHGTECCGVATALQNNGGLGVTGLAPGCRLIPTRRYNSNSIDEHGDAYIWASGFAPDNPDPAFPAPPAHPADVIVSSFGSNGLALSGLMKDAFDFITTYGRGGKGCVMIFSSGNDGIDVVARQWASYEKTICVAASDNAEVRAIFNAYQSSNFGDEVDICAPSSNLIEKICTTYFVGTGNLAGSATPGASNDYVDTFGGTSSSAPLVAGLAALMLSANPNLTWIQVRDILRNTAVKIDAANTDVTGQWLDINGNPSVTSGLAPVFSNWYGHGRIDALAAVQAAHDLVGIDILTNVDTWIKENDSDVGDVPVSAPWWSPDVWVRNVAPAFDDPLHVNEHQSPIREQDNWIYVNVRNRGDVDSSDVYARVLITRWGGTQYIYSDDFLPEVSPSEMPGTPMTNGSYLIGEIHIPSVPAHGMVTVNTLWPEALIPPASATVGGVTYSWADSCLLVEISPHDGPVPTGNHTWDNNNLCQKNITIRDATDDDCTIAFLAGHNLELAEVVELRIERKHLPAKVKLFVDYIDRELTDRVANLLVRAQSKKQDEIRTCEMTFLEDTKTQMECTRGVDKKTCTIRKGTHLSVPCCPTGEQVHDYQLKQARYSGKTIFELPVAQRALAPLPRRKGEYQMVALRMEGLKNLDNGEYRIDVYQQGLLGQPQGMVNFIIRKK
ncbi:MAG: S8 family serine peptidase [Methanoregula sp.]|jgi:subtilisin family serine protease|nr:S8 family serine peptidase [Methanoregula sp.]